MGSDPLPDVRLAYETWGDLSPARDNAVLVLHALTGDSHVVGPAGPGHPTPGWWGTLIGPGGWIDTDSWYVVAANILGGCQGSTGPASAAPDGRPWGIALPSDHHPGPGRRRDAARRRPRDRAVGAHARRVRPAGCERWSGRWRHRSGSIGCCCSRPPRRPRRTRSRGAGHRPQAIRSDPAWAGGDFDRSGTGARRRARGGAADRARDVPVGRGTGEPLRPGDQAGESVPDGGRYAVESYLDYHGRKLVGRFDAGSYVVLTEAMNSHDVGRDRGGIEAALARITARTAVAGIDSDRLYPLEQSAALPPASRQPARCR